MRESVKLFQRMVRTELQGRGSFVLFGQKNPPPLGGVLFFSPLPLLLASGTMGIVMAIAPLWVKRQKGMTQSSRKHCISQW